MKKLSVLFAAILITAVFAGCGGTGGNVEAAANGEKEMKIIDLTHLMTEDMPVFPGDDQPIFAPAATHEEDGYQMTLISTQSHVGTHMDAPVHTVAGMTTLDKMPIEQFVGKALVVDCTDLEEGQSITMDYINKNRDKADEAEFILFWLGWDQYWRTDKYYGDYPCIDDEVIQYVIDGKKKGVGFDVMGPDPIEAEDLIIHNSLLSTNEMIIMENLNNLGLCGDDLFTLCALPLKYENSDGAQTRAIAIIEE